MEMLKYKNETMICIGGCLCATACNLGLHNYFISLIFLKTFQIFFSELGWVTV